MTRIDFYVLDKATAGDHDRMICRVVEKAWRRGHHVYVRCADVARAQAFDDLLWRFEDTSFVPHALDDDEAPILIGVAPEKAGQRDVLVNLAQQVPAEASSFERVIESAGFDDPSRADARLRYRFYQERGFPLNTHKIGR